MQLSLDAPLNYIPHEFFLSLAHFIGKKTHEIN